MKNQALHLRLRYLTALLLIALLTSFSAFLFFTVLDQQNDDADKINVSGRQRMLSQKIALSVTRLDESGYREQARLDLQQAVNRFEQSHLYLTTNADELSPELAALYYGGSPSLDSLIKLYVSAARALFSGKADSHDQSVFSAGFTEPLLFQLNAVVEQYESEANERVQILKKLELAVWITSLLLLVLEARFIFYPMEVSIKSYIRELTEKLNAIQSLDSEKKQLEKIANQDPLTGLYSLKAARDFLQQLINKANQQNYELAVMFLDLDNFKPINDQYGHDVGDTVLVETARRIKKEMRTQDIACRVGGDEFLLVVDQLSTRAQLEFLCNRLLSAISKPIEINGETILIHASIGCAIFPEHAVDASELKKLADDAMYEAKRQGKNSFYIFDQQVAKV